MSRAYVSAWSLIDDVNNGYRKLTGRGFYQGRQWSSEYSRHMYVFADGTRWQTYQAAVTWMLRAHRQAVIDGSKR